MPVLKSKRVDRSRGVESTLRKWGVVIIHDAGIPATTRPLLVYPYCWCFQWCCLLSVNAYQLTNITSRDADGISIFQRWDMWAGKGRKHHKTDEAFFEVGWQTIQSMGLRAWLAELIRWIKLIKLIKELNWLVKQLNGSRLDTHSCVSQLWLHFLTRGEMKRTDMTQRSQNNLIDHTVSCI